MSATIHATAEIHKTAEIGDNVCIAANAEVGPGCSIGAGTRIGRGSVIVRDTRLGKDCNLGPYAVLGGDPQDLKYKGETTRLVIGDRNDIREFSTFNRGTGAGSGETRIGNDCLFMSHSHVAHDVCIGDHVVMSNYSGVAGHVQVGDYARIGGAVVVHQNCRIGKYAHIGLGATVLNDVPAYFLTTGNPARALGINSVLLERCNFTPEQIKNIKRGFQVVCIEPRTRANRLDKLQRLAAGVPEVMDIYDDLVASSRGIVSPLRRS